jgi:hypothetical protein
MECLDCASNLCNIIVVLLFESVRCPVSGVLCCFTKPPLVIINRCCLPPLFYVHALCSNCGSYPFEIVNRLGCLNLCCPVFAITTLPIGFCMNLVANCAGTLASRLVNIVSCYNQCMTQCCFIEHKLSVRSYPLQCITK